MAKGKAKEEKLNYNAEVRELKEQGPGRLYLLWGPEDYLRELFVEELKKICLPELDDGFSYKRMDGPDIDAEELREAVDAVPFLSERTFVELRGVDINRVSDPDMVWKALSDIPEYCTVCFVQNTQFEPDGRLKLIKNIRTAARELKFTRQSQSQLTSWVLKRFSALGKNVELEAIHRLLFISGDIMSRLIQEIEKIAAYAKGETVTVDDVEAVANHIPEAIIFDMTDYIAKREYNNAARVLSELLSDKNNEPIPMLALLGQQMRRLYAARVCIDQQMGNQWLMDICGVKYEFIVTKLLSSARSFSLSQLKRGVEICAETDYRMKGGSKAEPAELLKEAVMRIAAGEGDA